MKRFFNVAAWGWPAIVLLLIADTAAACHAFGGQCTCGNIGATCQPCNYDQTYSTQYAQLSNSYVAPAAQTAQDYYASAAASGYPTDTSQNRYNEYTYTGADGGPYQSLSGSYQPQQPYSSASSSLISPNSLPITELSGIDYLSNNLNPQNSYQSQPAVNLTSSEYVQSGDRQNSLADLFDFNGIVNGIPDTTYGFRSTFSTLPPYDSYEQTPSPEPPPSPFLEQSGYENRLPYDKTGKSGSNNAQSEGTGSEPEREASVWKRVEQPSKPYEEIHNVAVDPYQVISRGNQKQMAIASQPAEINTKSVPRAEYSALPSKNTNNYAKSLNEQPKEDKIYRATISETKLITKSQMPEKTFSAKENRALPQVQVSASLETAESDRGNSKASENTSDYTDRENKKAEVAERPEDEENCEPIMREVTEESKSPYVTYYHQACTGTTLGVSHGETIVSAARKCATLKCDAANAIPEGDGRYEVVFLKELVGRIQKPGTYCISGIAVGSIKKNVDNNPSDPTLKLHIYPVKRVITENENENSGMPSVNNDSVEAISDNSKHRGFSNVRRKEWNRRLPTKVLRRFTRIL